MSKLLPDELCTSLISCSDVCFTLHESHFSVACLPTVRRGHGGSSRRCLRPRRSLSWEQPADPFQEFLPLVILEKIQSGIYSAVGKHILTTVHDATQVDLKRVKSVCSQDIATSPDVRGQVLRLCSTSRCRSEDVNLLLSQTKRGERNIYLWTRLCHVEKKKSSFSFNVSKPKLLS